ncbi:DNA primase [Actinomycetaceae bacterium MB13-C1-2]|nr:DNA primase [Actinomycetaceae bacterium MB13-C1-2]
MPGRIRREDIDAVRERARIESVVGEQVTLKGAGAGSMKGLCPFHDERTPSFHVRPGLGLWHCFGCDEGGDVFSFVQKLNHLSFAEAVEYLAGKYGVTLRYEDGEGPRRGSEPGKRQRLLEAHRVAQDFYRGYLDSPEAKEAREFVQGRGFGKAEVDRFGVGASPSGWDGLIRHLRSKGFTEDELIASGLAVQGNRGPYDRFRNRVMWPIRDLTGATVGFGARRLGDDPNSPKYLNTPETAIYKKSQVLYGIDLAKKDIAKQRKVVIVEGYTDVMAAHASGETTAVATCGTAFGREHTQIVRRLLGDVQSPAAGVVLSDGRAHGGQVIFTFDGDEAGKAAARRAYVQDQSFAAQTFVAVDPEGKDPCDLWTQRGPEAVQRLIASRVPLFEFVLRSVLGELDLTNAEGRVQGLRACAPILAGIKDRALRSEYTRQVAGWLGMEPREVESAQHAASRERPPQDLRNTGGSSPVTAPVRRPSQLPTDPASLSERYALAATIQHPLEVVGAGFEMLEADSFSVPTHRLVFDVITANGGLDSFLDELSKAEKEVGVGSDSVNLAVRRWGEHLLDGLDQSARDQVTALVLTDLPVNEGEQGAVRDYAQGIVRSLVRRDLLRQASNLQAQLRRSEPESDEYKQAFIQLIDIDKKRRSYSDLS